MPGIEFRPGQRLVMPNARVLQLGAAAVPWQNNGTWNNLFPPFSNSPTLGSELLTNGGLEGAYVAGVAPSWTTIGTLTATESADAHGGTSAQQMTGTDGSLGEGLQQLFTPVAGQWYQASMWAKATNAVSTRITIYNAPFGSVGTGLATSAAYVFIPTIGRTSNTNPASYLLLYNFGSGGIGRFDDVSLKPLILNQLFNVRLGASLPASVAAAGTIAAGTIAGVVYGLDSISSPSNVIIATHDGVSTLKLEKLVSGTWTTVLTQTVAYVSGQLPSIRWVSANTFALDYNGTQRGANQTISDAGTGLYHGVISTYSGNTITSCTVTP